MRSRRPILCLVVDREASRHPLASAVEAAFAAGADWLQLRDRGEPPLAADALLAWSEALARAALRGARKTATRRESGGTHTPGAYPVLLVNRRLDIALALEDRLAADDGSRAVDDGTRAAAAVGVHLGFDAVDVAAARALLGAARPVGISAHDANEVEAAARAGASYAHLAPIFDPRSKAASRPPLGMEALARASRHAIDVLAQGGLDGPRSADAVHAGAAGVAVTGAILQSADPGRATRALRSALDGA